MKTKKKTQFIVAEISKTWRNGKSVGEEAILAQLFERVIEINNVRGYRLHSFELHRVFAGEDLNETIIAVFQLAPGRRPK